MAHAKMKTYWLILLALVLLATAVLSVGESQARYEADTLVFNTVVEPGAQAVTSDCLVPVTGAPLTVLLGQTETASFMLEPAWDTTGALTWQADQPEFLDVRLSIGMTFLTQGQPIELTGGIPVPVVMTLNPTAKAMTTVHEEMDIKVTVRWNQTLEGTFLVTLPPVTEEDLVQSEPVQENETAALPVINGQVAVEGRDPLEGEFTFRLYSTDQTFTLAEEAVPVATAVNDSRGTFGFPDVTFETPRIYYYVVDQAPAAAADSVIRDDTRYMVCVVVTDTDGVLTVQTAVSAGQGTVSGILFTNTETAASYTIAGTKTVSGMALEPEQFRFVLFRADASFENRLEPLQVAVNGADGSFAFETLTYDTAGTYYYIVDEDRSQPLTNVSYQEISYAVTVTVTDDGSGNLSAAASIALRGGDAVDAITFHSAYTPGEGEAAAVALDTIPGFDPAGALPVRVTPGARTERVLLGLGTDGSEEVTPFPAYTRYSLDGGKSCFMLYLPGTITLDKEEDLLLDLSRTGLTAGADVILRAQAYTGQWLIGTADAAANAMAAGSHQLSSAFLAADAPLVVTLPEQWTGCTLEYTVEMLTATTVTDEQTGETIYLPADYTAVDLTAGSLTAVHAAGENGHTLTLSAGTSLPPAGTYRLTMKWTNKEICFEGTQITFFINYSVTQKQTQQEVPNDE